ncbi:MAG: 50S ribosomal protein L4 [Ruminococcaceae bacterium]|nr:50S ribosomal protein L4 [Oscillospiraceae bacterium]
MAKLTVYDMDGNEVSKIELNDSIFSIEPHKTLMHRAVVRHLANKRQGTQSTKTRAEVSGGGRKPWRQKGTGRARQGSTRSPQWRHGGVALGPKPRDYSISMNKKEIKTAIKSALSSKLLSNDILVVDNIALDGFKTKKIAGMLNALKVEKKALLVMPESNVFVTKSANNIPGIKTSLYNTLNVYDILNYDKFIITVEAVKKIEEVWA